MERVLLDTNVVVSFLHRRSAQEQLLASRLFERASRGTLLPLLDQHVLGETVQVFQDVYSLAPGDIARIVKDLCLLPGLERVDRLRDRLLFDPWPDRMRDFGDAVVAAAAMGEACLVDTFDRRFRNTLSRLGVHLYTWN